MTERYHTLQILRAFAAWMVFYYHFMMQFHQFQTDNILGYAFSEYGEFGVDIFFVLSGFVMYFSASPNNTKSYSFFIKRVFRVVPTYWFYTFMVIFCLALFPIGFSYTDYTAKSLVLSLFFIPHDNPSGWMPSPLLTVGWTLNFEMAFYTILSISLAISRKHARILCFLIVAALPLVWPKNTFFSAVLGNTLLYEFLAGFSVAYLISTQFFKIIFKARLIAALVTGFAGLVLWKYFHVHDIFRLLAASFIVLSAVLFNRYIHEKNIFASFLIKLGDYSYSTYLAHTIILGIVYHFFHETLSSTQETILLIAMTMALLMISKVSYDLIEQNRHLIRLKNILLGRFALAE
ncbi:MAG: acyltransferase [Alphaproteobacteria bacterium]|nr:acyltransferase [Alphaproteobacteria bacterium]HPF46319.1 acyltransferase [Emcibacteraceae bacterium]